MKNKQLFDFLKNYESISKLKGVKFAYTIAKNKRLIDNEVEALRKSLNPTEGFQKYEKERNKLLVEMAKKDKNGKPLFIDENHYDIEDMNVFQKRHEELAEKYATEIKEREEQTRSFNRLLGDDCTIEFHKLHIKYLDENITPVLMESIVEFITEADEGK